MDAGLIVRLPFFELRRAAANGTAYYSCEQFEDSYGRLVVGIGPGGGVRRYGVPLGPAAGDTARVGAGPNGTGDEGTGVTS